MSKRKVEPTEKLVEMYRAGMTCADIGRKLGLSRQAVHFRLVDNGIIKPRLTTRSWSPTDIHILREMYPMHAAAGMLTELARSMGKSYGTIMIKAGQLKLRNPANRGRKTGRQKKRLKRK